MTLVRSDPFGEVDRMLGRLSSDGFSRSVGIPLDAYRRGDQLVVELDLPGVRSEDTELTIENGVLTVKATRPPRDRADGEPLISERPFGTFTRQLVLGDTLDSERIEADFANGVLTVTIPVAERAKPRRIDVRHKDRSPELATVGT